MIQVGVPHHEPHHLKNLAIVDILKTLLIFRGTLHFTVPEYYVNSHTPSRKTYSGFFAMAMNTNENNLVYDDIYKTTTDKFYLHPNNFSIKWSDYFSFFYIMF